MNHKTLADRAVQYASRSYLLSTGELRPAFITNVVAVPAVAMPLLMNAAERLPSGTRIEQPVIRTGFIYFEEEWPRPERGVAWQGLFFSYEVLNDDGTPVVFGVHHEPLYLKKDGSWLPLNAPDELPEDDLRYRVITAFNLLIEQNVVITTDERPGRQTRRRSERKGQNLPANVTIIQLPHRVYQSSNEGTRHDRYSHQWLVSGHWRQQPYPSVDEIRPLWIAPYVKGPENKPLVIKERRYIFNPPTNEDT